MFAQIKIVSFLLVAVCSVLSVQANAVPKPECPSVCPALYAPVCAASDKNFKEFSNACMLKNSNCQMELEKLKQFKEVDMAWCKTKQVENMDAIVGNLDLNNSECMKPCTMIYAPLCVANDKYRTTISSQCVLDMYNCNLKHTGAQTLFKVLKENSC